MNRQNFTDSPGSNDMGVVHHKKFTFLCCHITSHNCFCSWCYFWAKIISYCKVFKLCVSVPLSWEIQERPSLIRFDGLSIRFSGALLICYVTHRPLI